MSNLGLFFHSRYSNQEAYLNYIKDQIKPINSDRSLSFEFQVVNNMTMGLLSWGVFGGVFSKEHINVLFDGYLLDDYALSKQDQCELLCSEFLTKGIDFIKKRNFFGNIIISSKEKSYIITSQHTIFYLFYTITKDKELIVAPAIKFILPFIKQLDINFHAYYELLKLEHCVDNKTLFKDIHKVGSNTIIEYCHTSQKIQLTDYSQDYWNATPNVVLTGNAKIDAKKINNLFQESTKRCTHIVKNKPLSLSFSGGTDSSYILSHLLDRHLPVRLSTKFLGAKKAAVISTILEKLKNVYPNIDINTHYFNYSNLTYENCIDIIDQSLFLREVVRPLADWHVSCLADSESWACFTDGAPGDALVGVSKVDWIGRWVRVFQNIIPSKLIVKINEATHKNKLLSDHFKLPYHSQNSLLENYNSSMLVDHCILLIQNRTYNFTNDHVHMLRNYKEYFLTPFYENDFFRVVMQYPYSEKYRHKLYFYLLNEQGKYFHSIPIENTNGTLPSSYHQYSLKRSDRSFELVWNKIKSNKSNQGLYKHCISFYDHFRNYESGNIAKLNEMSLNIKSDVNVVVQSFILDRYIEQSMKKLNQF